MKIALTHLIQIRTNNNLITKIYYENIVNAALLKKICNTHKISQHFSQR